MKCCAGIDSQRFSFGRLENQLHRPVTRRSREQRLNLPQFSTTRIRRKMQTKWRRHDAGWI